MTSEDTGEVLELTGTPGPSATLSRSADLITWNPVRTETPFSGHLRFPVATGQGGAAQLFRAAVTP